MAGSAPLLLKSLKLAVTQTLPVEARGRSEHLAPAGDYILFKDVFPRMYRQHAPKREFPFPIHEERQSPSSCKVVRSGDIERFRLTDSEGWAEYGDILQAFEAQRKAGVKAKTGPYPEAVISAPVKLVIREAGPPIRALLTTDRVYPRRAKLAVPAASSSLMLAYAALGVVNSPIGQVWYEMIAQERPKRTNDLTTRHLGLIPIAPRDYSPNALSMVADLGHRLSAIYQGELECRPLVEDAFTFDSLVRNQWWHLHSAVAHLLRLSEPEAEGLFAQVRDSFQREMGGEEQLALAEAPRDLPRLPPLRILSKYQMERFEELKDQSRSGSIAQAGRHELTRLRRLLEWEDRINSPAPTYLAVRAWPGILTERQALRAADRYMYRHLGERFFAQEAKQTEAGTWQVEMVFSCPSSLPPAERARIPVAWRSPGLHSAGRLLINQVSGEIQEVLAIQEDAAAVAT